MIETGLKYELSQILDKVYPIQSAEGTQAPYIIYQRQRTDRVQNLTDYDGLVEVSFQIDTYHANYSSLKTLSTSIINMLKGLQSRNIGHSNEYIQQVVIENDFDTYEELPHLYRNIIEVNLFYKED